MPIPLSSSSLIVVTENPDKFKDIVSMTGLQVERIDLNLPEIQSVDVEEVARYKALSAYDKLSRPLIVDDSGLFVDAWNGLPGALVNWFLDRLGPEGFLRLFDEVSDRHAYVSTCIALADAKGVRTFVGTVRGTLSHEPRGSGGFGYDVMFIPQGQTKTYAEMQASNRAKYSMRMIAIQKLREYLSR